MGQLTIYLPDEVEAALRRDAKRAGKSMSAWVVERVSPPRSSDHQAALQRLLGKWKGDFPEPEDLPPRDVSALE